MRIFHSLVVENRVYPGCAGWGRNFGLCDRLDDWIAANENLIQVSMIGMYTKQWGDSTMVTSPQFLSSSPDEPSRQQSLLGRCGVLKVWDEKGSTAGRLAGRLY